MRITRASYPVVRERPSERDCLAHERFDLGRLAALGVARVGMAAVHALLAEAGALPDEVVNRALQLRDLVFQLLDGGVRWHETKGRGTWDVERVDDGEDGMRGRENVRRGTQDV